MNINVKILYDKLKRKYPIKIYGEKNSDFIQYSPEFYTSNSNHFYSDRVYLASIDYLPSRPLIEKNVLIISIGDSNRLLYYKEHATMIVIQNKVDFFEVYNYLKNIFEQYYQWESQLLNLFMENSTIQEILDATYPIIERSIFILGSNFQHIASVYSDVISDDNIWTSNQRNLDTDAFITFLKEEDVMMDKRGAFFLDLETEKLLVNNLFNSSGEYIGCIFLYQEDKPFIEGEEDLVENLAKIIEWVSQTNPKLLNHEQISLKKSLQTMMNEMPLSKSQRLLIKSANYKKNYFCIAIHNIKNTSTLPVNYLCSMFESMFIDSIFFDHNNTILGLIPIKHNDKSYNSTDSLIKKIKDIVTDMQVYVGVSNEFNDFYMLNNYYKQAGAAIENGRIYQADKNFYFFSDFALTELVTNSLGNFPLDTYFPRGFDDILSHDLRGGVSYLETLSVFLDESMSYSNAAKRLFIHRSTLIERINRIKNLLSIDLENPDHRLQLQIIMKLIDIENSLENQIKRVFFSQ